MVHPPHTTNRQPTTKAKAKAKAPKRLPKPPTKFWMDSTHAFNPFCLLCSLTIYTLLTLTILSLIYELLSTISTLLPHVISSIHSALSALITSPPVQFLLTALATLITLYLVYLTLWYTTALSTYPLWRRSKIPPEQDSSHWSVFRVYVIYATACFATLWMWTGSFGWIGRDGWVVGFVRGVVVFEGLVGGVVHVVQELDDD